jgi:GNAT superfamily N-acetyltransferase
MTVSIRPAQSSDASRIAELTAQLGYQLSATAAAERLAGIRAQQDHALWVADLDGHVIGWLHALVAHYMDAEPYVLIGGLVVDAAHRGQAVGRTLVAEAERWAADRGCALVRVSSSSRRTAAHRFYQQLGYTIVKTQHAFAKSLRPDGAATLSALSPVVDADR